MTEIITLRREDVRHLAEKIAALDATWREVRFDTSSRLIGIEKVILDAAIKVPNFTPARDLPYDAVSVNGRAMEWKAPLWDAINEWRRAVLPAPVDRDRVERAVVQVEESVEVAMRLALEYASAPEVPSEPQDDDFGPVNLNAEPMDLVRQSLAPCPHCGWERPILTPSLIYNDELAESPFVRCIECGATVLGDFDDEQEAVAAWNRRATPPLTSEEAGEPEWGTERRYLTDDRDSRRRNELVIEMGGNGDWYVAVAPEGEGAVGRGVRICTSGGAASRVPGLGNAIASAYRAMGGENPPPLDLAALAEELSRDVRRRACGANEKNNAPYFLAILQRATGRVQTSAPEPAEHALCPKCEPCENCGRRACRGDCS